ncbi:F0F1 ATP synthase subunit B [Reichenbachiella sp. MALMAid0571]|uniref:F0F1 ATP synthase subunit B n=1 Tax=Reichenbachiella sp. MALMAid0571 TaxID=3143939 RepID=UPI0032DF5E90
MELVTPDIGLIFWQTVVFLIVFAILAAKVWKPISEALKSRDGFIRDSLQSAEAAKEEMKQLKADNEYLLKEARIERDNMLKEATKIASDIKEAAKEETSKISSKMIADAKAVIETEKKAALADVKSLVAALSLDIAEKVLRKNLDDKKSQEALVKDLIKDIKVN